uniref:Capsid protein n=1 Tax=viral metagenome TaxID=1070528 RepID=A0A2V0RBD6_9ZZZZ
MTRTSVVKMYVPMLPGRPGTVTRPAISPQTLPQTQLDPSMGNGNRAQIRTNNSNANAPSNRPNELPSGNRIGGRFPNRQQRRNNNNSRPVVPIMRERGGRNNNSNLKVVAGDFGFNIDGSNSPNVYTGHSETTLFRDYNKNSVKVENTGLNENNLTNAFKVLNIDFAQSILTGGYSDAYKVIRNKLERTIISSTNASRGAMDIIQAQNISLYLDSVVKAFDILIELEVMQAWDPDSNQSYDKTLRTLASKVSIAEVLEYRNKIRMALIPHVLPLGWMQYIKWLRETHLQNEVAESTKLRFVSTVTVSAMDDALQGKEFSTWTWKSRVDAILTDLNNQDPRIPALIMAKVEDPDFSFQNVKDHYTLVHNSASYDPNFNDLYNNRTILWGTGTTTSSYPKLTGTQNGYAAFHRVDPYAMCLAQIGTQMNITTGVPLEGKNQPVKVGEEGTLNTHFFIEGPIAGNINYRVRGVEHWYEYHDDSVHNIDLTAAGAPTKAYSTPKGIHVLNYVASSSNIQMAARESLTRLTLSNF